MHQNRLLGPITGLLALAFATSLFAHGQFWDFLGYTQVDGGRDHSRIEIARRDLLFRTIQLRVIGDAIFFDRVVVHFDDGSSQEVIVNDRISSQARNNVIELRGERRALESVELWYYKERWGHNPRVSVYGMRWSEPEGESIARQQ